MQLERRCDGDARVEGGLDNVGLDALVDALEQLHLGDFKRLEVERQVAQQTNHFLSRPQRTAFPIAAHAACKSSTDEAPKERKEHTKEHHMTHKQAKH